MEDLMENGFYLITGTSRGIGAALARKLLEKGNTVLGISRKPSVSFNSKKYHHLAFDLAITSRLDQVMDKVNQIVGDQRFDLVCLVNNASAVEPLGPIENCPASKIESHLHTGLIAPMLLTSMFIRRFKDEEMRKKVVFISSGAAFTALPDQSIYCSSKAGLKMFAECVGLEQKNEAYGFEINSIGPGMVDTAMQQKIRSKSSDEFAMAGFFKQAFEDGKLQDPAEVAEGIYTLLGSTNEQGKYVSVNGG
jgi:benzil reductase ((S)-benzoin forming)